MKIALIADGRSNNFRRWVRYFVECGDDVNVLSTYPCQPIEAAELFTLSTPIKFGNTFVKSSAPPSKDLVQNNHSIVSVLKGFLIKTMLPLWSLWTLIKVINLPFQVLQARSRLKKLKPDLVVAFRTQNEGYIAAWTGTHPIVLFTQGSDFIYMADRHPLHAFLTKITVRRIDALLSDCERDVRLAKRYGMSLDRPAQVFPGNGGVNLSVFEPGMDADKRKRWVIYPRGLTPYLRLDTFLTSVRELQKNSKYHDVNYIFLGAASVVSVMQRMAEKQGLDMDGVSIKTFLSEQELVSLLQQSSVLVSPSMTDGTPNTMLEAMACGAFPIMSDLESIQEWIQDGENGLIFDPNSPEKLTNCMQRALDDASLRQTAQSKNLEIIRERADRKLVMPATRKFLLDIAENQSTVAIENTEVSCSGVVD